MESVDNRFTSQVDFNSIEFLYARTVWQLVYKEDFKCTRVVSLESFITI